MSFLKGVSMADEELHVHKNPSREACEKIIKRILVTEVLEKGRNTQFRNAASFMGYFESLYPASPGLTKQVQRAVKAMDLPKDENGYYMINKTGSQVTEDKEMRSLCEKYDARLLDLSDTECVFLKLLSPAARSYLSEQLLKSKTFSDKIITITESANGLILYTRQKQRLMSNLKNTLLPDLLSDNTENNQTE